MDIHVSQLAGTLEKLSKEIKRLKAREAELTAEINGIKTRLGGLEGADPKYDKMWIDGKMCYRFYITKLRETGIPEPLQDNRCLYVNFKYKALRASGGQLFLEHLETNEGHFHHTRHKIELLVNAQKVQPNSQLFVEVP